MRGQKKPFASPHAISHSNKKVPSGQELSDQIVALFKNPDSAVKPIPMSNDRQVIASVTALITQYKSSSDWDSKLDVITQFMGIVSGGACNFISFMQHVDKLEPLISECILSLRGALVKYTCLLVAQLSEKLCQSFANTVLSLIPTLFRPTQNGTLIIADSCKLAILSVARCCQSKKVLLSILELHTSKSGVQRTLVAHCVFLIVSNWERDIVVGSFRAIEKVLLVLLNDPSAEARQFARDTVRKLQEIVPEKCKRMMEKTDQRTRVSLIGPQETETTVKPSKRAASVSNDRRANPVRQSAVTPKAAKMAMAQVEKPVFEKGKERPYFSYLRQLILQGESEEIVQKASEVSESIISSMTGPTQEIVVLSMTILDGVLTIIPDAFLVHLPVILGVLFEQSLKDGAGTKRIAEKLIGVVSELYPADELLDAALKCRASWPAFLFVDKVVHGKNVKLTSDMIGVIVTLCITADCRDAQQEDPKELVVSLLLFLRTKFADEFMTAAKDFDQSTQTCLKELGLDPSDKEATILEPAEEPQLQENSERTEVMPLEKSTMEAVVVKPRPVGKLMTLALFDVPPEPQLMWQLENSPSTIVTIEPTHQPRSPVANKGPFQKAEEPPKVKSEETKPETQKQADQKETAEVPKQEEHQKTEREGNKEQLNQEKVVPEKPSPLRRVQLASETIEAQPRPKMQIGKQESFDISLEKASTPKKQEPRSDIHAVQMLASISEEERSPVLSLQRKKQEESPPKRLAPPKKQPEPKPADEPKKVQDVEPRRVAPRQELDEPLYVVKKPEPKRTARQQQLGDPRRVTRPEIEEEIKYQAKAEPDEPKYVATTPQPKKVSEPSTTIDPRDEEFIERIRAQVQAIEHHTMPQLVRMLLTIDDKIPALEQIGALIEAEKGRDIDIALPHLIRLTRTSVSNEVECVLQIAGNYINSAELLDMVIGLLDEPDPCPFIEFLSRVVACATKIELAPRIRKMMNRLVPFLSHSAADVRKHAVLCIVEIRFVMGASFDMEIARLKNVPRKLVIHYFQKRQAQS